MAKQISAKVIQIHGIFIDSNTNFVTKPLDQSITIGSDRGNDIFKMYPFISPQHGRIFLESGFMGFTEHLDFEDFSEKGSNVIHWNSTEAKSELVHNRKIKIKPGDWILISDKGEFGILIIPHIR